VKFVTASAGGDDLVHQIYAHVPAVHGGDILNDDFSILDARWP
jgi:hypothetical protein